jgi:hypothetical protein
MRNGRLSGRWNPRLADPDRLAGRGDGMEAEFADAFGRPSERYWVDQKEVQLKKARGAGVLKRTLQGYCDILESVKKDMRNRALHINTKIIIVSVSRISRLIEWCK